jgi:hypothetical protein
MTIQDLKNRKSYIIAKITKVAGEENLKSYMNLMLWIVENENFNGNAFDLFNNVHFQLRARAKRSGHKLAEFAGNNENKTFNQLTKEYQYN